MAGGGSFAGSDQSNLSISSILSKKPESLAEKPGISKKTKIFAKHTCGGGSDLIN